MKHPEYDRSKFKVWALPHPLILHWVLNPGLAFNELVLGQRLPRVTLIDRTSDEPLRDRTYVPCPHCKSLHNSRVARASWGSFGNWFGFVCPNCKKDIPALWNIFSLLILAVTSPFWILPVHYLRPRWRARKAAQMTVVDDSSQTPFEPLNVVSVARGIVTYGGGMWLAKLVIFIQRDPAHWNGIDWSQRLAVLPECLVFGALVMIFHAIMHFWSRRKGRSLPSA